MVVKTRDLHSPPRTRATLFRLEPAPDGSDASGAFRFRPVPEGQCVGTADGTAAEGVEAVREPCADSRTSTSSSGRIETADVDTGRGRRAKSFAGPRPSGHVHADRVTEQAVRVGHVLRRETALAGDRARDVLAGASSTASICFSSTPSSAVCLVPRVSVIVK